MNIPYGHLVNLIDTNEECLEYVKEKYPQYFSYYERFAKVNGPGCPFARAALKNIYVEEFKERGTEFIGSISSGTWGTSKYRR